MLLLSNRLDYYLELSTKLLFTKECLPNYIELLVLLGVRPNRVYFIKSDSILETLLVWDSIT